MYVSYSLGKACTQQIKDSHPNVLTYEIDSHTLESVSQFAMRISLFSSLHHTVSSRKAWLHWHQPTCNNQYRGTVRSRGKSVEEVANVEGCYLLQPTRGLEERHINLTQQPMEMTANEQGYR